jgi:hypothetical protein
MMIRPDSEIFRLHKFICAIFKFSFVFLISVLCLLSSASPAKAAVPMLELEEFDSLDGVLTLNKDASLRAEIRLAVSGFTTGENRWFVIGAPPSRVSDVSVESNGEKLSEIEVSSTVSKIDFDEMGNEAKKNITLADRTAVGWSRRANDQYTLKFTVLNAVTPEADTDVLSYILFDGTHEAAIDSVKMRVIFPESADLSKYKQYVFAAHGIDNAAVKIIDEKTLEAKGENAQSTANFTLIATFKKGLVNYPFGTWLKTLLVFLPWYWWIGTGALIPLATIVLMNFIAIKRKGRDLFLGTPKQKFSAPPSELAPAVVGVLYHQKVSAKEIAATILSLAARGYIQIVERPVEFILGQRKAFTDLVGFERLLAEELFGGIGTISSSDIKLRRQASRGLYSRRIAALYTQLYREGVHRGFYKEDPSSVHIKYFGLGVIVFFGGVLSFLPAVTFLAYIIFLPFALLGVVLAGIVIIVMSRRLPTPRTSLGRSELLRWRGYGEYLAEFQPLGTREVFEEVFVKNLPYAMVMDMGERWAEIFAGLPFYLPRWYITEVPLPNTVSFYKKISETALTLAKTTDPSLR